MEKKHPFLSRKFLVAVGVILSIILKEYIGIDLDPKEIAWLVAIAAAYIFGEAAVDWKAVKERVVVIWEGDDKEECVMPWDEEENEEENIL